MADFLSEDQIDVPAQLFDRFESASPRGVEALSRDLADLLGARRAFSGAMPGILAWGLPGMAGIAPGSDGDRERVAELMAAAIRDFEPRLADVRVRPAGDSVDFVFVLEATVVGAEAEGVRLRILAPRRGGGLSAEVRHLGSQEA